MPCLDNPLVAPYFPPAYYLAMSGIAFKDRVLAALDVAGISKAELSRRSGVPYHAIDKFLKRDNATTSAENASAIAKTLGITVDGDQEYEQLREMFYRLSEEQRQFLLASVRGLLGLEG
jgi:lambda repressor-like predicted transcriptional regulator